MERPDFPAHHLSVVEQKRLMQELLDALRSRRPELLKLWEQYSGHWGYEDSIYRFYHQSFKVFRLQGATEKIVGELQALMPERKLNRLFLQIMQEGTGHKFEESCNDAWLQHTRPIVEAFFHARFMLEMAVRYSSLEELPDVLPSGWAALLYLYNLR